MLQEKVNANVRRLRMWRVVTSVSPLPILAAVLTLMFTDVLTPVQTCLLYVVIALLERLAARFIMAFAWKKYVYGALYEELDAPLYVEILKRMGKYDPFALCRLQELDAEGRHADVVSLCTKQLDNPYAKRVKHLYLSYMEAAYFDLGDDQKLREIHEATEWYLASQKNPQKAKASMPLHAFFTAYLKRDLDACETYFTAVPPRNRFSTVNRCLLRARVAQLRGNTDEAAGHLRQVLAEAPNTPLAVTAKAHLDALERGEDYETAFPEVLPDPLFPVLTSEKKHKTIQILFRICMIVAAVSVGLVLVLNGMGNAESKAYREKVRVAMEGSYDGVEVLDWFTLSDGEKTMDSVAVCATDSGIIMTALYYVDDPDEVLCHTMVTFTEEAFEGDVLPSRIFRGFTSDYYGTCSFYSSEKDVPKEAEFSCTVTVGGRELWLAVVYVGAEPPSNMV